MDLKNSEEFIELSMTRLPRASAREELAERAAGDVLEAFALLTQRGPGDGAWAAPFRQDPIAFLLDSISDAANVWSKDGDLLYRNRAAAKLGLGYFHTAPVQQFSVADRWFERRSMRCRAHGFEYLLEIIRELEDDQNAAT